MAEIKVCTQGLDQHLHKNTHRIVLVSRHSFFGDAIWVSSTERAVFHREKYIIRKANGVRAELG